MKKTLFWMLVAFSFWASYFYFRHYSQAKPATAHQTAADSSGDDAAQPSAAASTPAAPDANSSVQVKGPLAQFMDNVNPWHDNTPPPPPKLNPSDRIADSPVGTSSAIVHKTFAVTAAAKFPFQIPPHAANPQLHGTYRSFAQNAPGQSGGGQSSDEFADVDLLLMNDQQYSDFLHGQSPDVIYSVDASHEQDVSFGLPATLDQSVQYYLVFRNTSGGARKKLIQADFRVDF
jgi:hypothetical protein